MEKKGKNMMFKKIISIVVALVMALTLCACHAPEIDTESTPEESSENHYFAHIAIGDDVLCFEFESEIQKPGFAKFYPVGKDEPIIASHGTWVVFYNSCDICSQE